MKTAGTEETRRTWCYSLAAGTLSLPDGRQLFRRAEEDWCCQVDFEGKGHNTDAARRTFKLTAFARYANPPDGVFMIVTSADGMMVLGSNLSPRQQLLSFTHDALCSWTSQSASQPISSLFL